ncbi:hypothetical protein GEMRC1_008234 [Eukaryota sp. GEM-RC1]
MLYSKTSLIISVNDYVMELHQVSYISITGIDDPCCGSFDSPCASFRGVLDRMGRNGTVYLHEGTYSFNQGLGEVRDVDWEVIALGTVIIEGIDETLFEIVQSNLSLSTVHIFCYSPICFSLPDSTLQLINSSVLHDTTSTTTTLVDNPQDHWGHVSFIDSKLEFRSSLMYVSSLSLWSSTLKSSHFTFNNLQQVELDRESMMSLIDDSKILSDSLSITLNSSELFFDDSVDITSSSFSLITFNSEFQTDFDYSHMDLLDLSCSTFKSASLTEIVVDLFYCFNCQVLGNSSLLIESHSQINSGNFSSPLIIIETAKDVSFTGIVRFLNSIDLFSDVTLDDVTVFASSFSVSSNLVLLFKNHSTLTIYDTLLLNGGKFQTDITSSTSFTSSQLSCFGG